MNRAAHYFVIPGLFHVSPIDLEFISDDKYPNLSKFFKSSKRVNTNKQHLDDVLCEQLNYSSDIAPISHHFNSKKNVLIATPIRLKADINSTWIQPALSAQNMTKIIHDMVDFFAQDLSIIDQCGDHFVIHFKNVQVVNNLPNYLTVLGKTIDSYQQSIRENLEWFKLLNEIQMYLHGHELNKIDSGQQILNSLWFWGGDSTQSLTHKKQVRCDDALLQLALSQEDAQCEDKLLIKTDLLKYLKLNSALELDAFFYQLEQEFKGISLKKITIDTADGHSLVFDYWSKIKFWQQRLSLLDSLTMAQQDNSL